MTKKARNRNAGYQACQKRVDWIVSELLKYAHGVHELRPPAVVLDSALPFEVDVVYRTFDGGKFFHEALELFPARSLRVVRDETLVGSYHGDDITVTSEGVWRWDSDLEERVLEGSTFDRWLAGVVDAEAVLMDADGEFRDDVFDDQGELTASSSLDCERRRLRRDAGAVAPKWRLAKGLSGQGQLEHARDYLEEVVEVAPNFSWAWFDLARISERLGQWEQGAQEAEMAADCLGTIHTAFYLGHAARLASKAGDKEETLRLAKRALAEDPQFVARYREAAREELACGRCSEARELLAVAKAIAPRDLAVLDLLRQLEVESL